MADNFNSAYLAVRRDKDKSEREALMAEMDTMIADQAKRQASTAAPTKAPSEAPKEKSPGVLQETKRAVVGGVQDAVYNVTHMADEFAGWLNENYLHLRSSEAPTRFVQAGTKEAKRVDEQTSLAGVVSGKKWDATKVTTPETTAGKITRGLVSFGTTFAGTALATGGVGGGLLANVGRGAVADFAGQDPTDGNLSNLILEATKGDPYVGKELFKMLATDPNDSAAWNRSRNVLEGAGLGIAAEGLVKAVKLGVTKWRGAGKDPVEVIQEFVGPQQRSMDQLADEPAFMRRGPLSKADPVDTSKAPDLALAEQIDLLTGVSNRGTSKFQKHLDMQAALKESDKAAQPKGLELADGALHSAKVDSNPDAFLPKSKEMALEDPNAIPFERLKATGEPPSFPETLKLVEQDPAPRKLFLDPEDGTLSLSKEASHPQQLDLDLALPDVLKKTEHSPDEKAMLEGYKELQEKVLANAPETVDDAAKAATDLPQRIEKAQARVDALLAEGKDATTAQKVLDNLLKKQDGGLFDHATKLSGKEADKLATNGDPLVDAIAANNEKLLSAFGSQQGGFVSPSMLANMASFQVGGVTGFLSAEDDATLAERLSLAGLGGLAGLGVKVGASKVLKGHEMDVIKNASPELKSLARKEVANIAPQSLVAPKKKPPVISKANVESLVTAAREGGMENLAQAVKKSDFNFDHIDTPEEVKETIDAFSAVFEKETSLAKHGTQTFDDIKELANELGAGEKSLRDLYQGTNNLGARILAHRALLTASAEKVTQMAKVAAKGDMDAMLSLRKHVALHAQIQAQMKGIQTEVARGLASFRITSGSIDLAINERNQLIEAMGGHAANLKFAKQLEEITDPVALNSVIRKSAFARSSDALYEAWVNGLLSGPVTHAVNMVDNGLVAIASPAERLVAGMYGKVLNGGADAVKLGEAKAQLYGMVEGLVDAVRITKAGRGTLKEAAGEVLHGNFSSAKSLIEDSAKEFGGAWRAAATDAPVLDNAAYGTRQYDLQDSAISAGNLGFDQNAFIGKFVDGMGALIRTPGRLLTTSDEIFKTVHYRGELKAQAYRQAMGEGLHGDALFQRVATLVEDPTPDLSAMALDAARKGTFTNPLGETGGAIQNVINKVPGGRWIVPFVRTPTNIMKFVGERTPGLNLLSSNVRAEFAAGGARRDMMLAKTTTGAALYTIGGYMAAQGMITGGGEKDLTAEKMSGWQPYSIKVGDNYIAYNRMDPFGMFLGLAADGVDLSGHLDASEMDDFAAMSLLAAQRNLVSKTYMQGIINLIDAFQQPDRKGERYLQGLVGSMVPAVVNAARKEDDNLAREVWTYADAIKNRIPGLSKDLPPVRNVFGEEQKLVGGLGPDLISPFRTTEASTDPLANELARLNVDLQKPSKTLPTAPGAPGIDLTPEQYDKLVKVAGEMFKDQLGRTMERDSYKNLPENPDNEMYMEGKEKVIKSLYTSAKLAATRKLLAEDQELAAKWRQDKMNAGNALKGAPILPF